MAQKLKTITADVVVAFQQNPGIDNDSIIDAGDAQNLSTNATVRPVRGGYYGLRMPAGQSQQLQVFNTTYDVFRKAADTAEAAAFNKVISWDSFWTQGNKKLQHLLQLLGYYTGNIDGEHHLMTEIALLGFQADNDYRTDGFESLNDAQWMNNIEKVVNNKCKVRNRDSNTDVYLIRKPLLMFARAPSLVDPTAAVGDPDPEAPDIDDRGWIKVKTVNHSCHGPVMTMAGNSDFRVKVIRVGFGNNADLRVESEDNSLVTVQNPDLPNEQYMILRMRTGDPGNSSKKKKVFIKWRKDANTLITVATLRVIILPMITLTVKPWLVGIRSDPLDNSDRYPQSSDFIMNTIFSRTNAIWKPYGIRFNRLNPANISATLSSNDRLSKRNENLARESRSIFGRGRQANAINIYFVKQIEGAFGSTMSPHRHGRNNGIVVTLQSANLGRTGCTLAHELGHFLGLANNYGRNKYTHVEDDPDNSEENRKTDYWSIRRLMLGKQPSVLRPDDAWARNPGFGPNDRGRMLSVRSLSKDKTDDECRNVRKQANSGSVYG